METRSHGFRSDKKQKTDGGSIIYSRTVASDLVLFIRVMPNPKAYRDSFMIELGWSGDPSAQCLSLRHQPRINASVDGCMRLPDLWREEWLSKLQPWWEIGPRLAATDPEVFFAEAERSDSEEEVQRRVEMVPAVVADAVDRIERFGIPFLERVARERGIPVTLT